MAKDLYIPFSYHYDDALDYYGYGYYEDPNNTEIFWDTIKNVIVYPVHESNYRSPYESEERYLERMNNARIQKENFDTNLKNGNYITVDEIIWKKNYVFKDRLKYSGYSRGRSSAKIHFKSENNEKEYEMFLTDFDDMMENVGFNKNILEGEFTFCKRGTNYGIKMVNEQNGVGL